MGVSGCRAASDCLWAGVGNIQVGNIQAASILADNIQATTSNARAGSTPSTDNVPVVSIPVGNRE